MIIVGLPSDDLHWGVADLYFVFFSFLPSLISPISEHISTIMLPNRVLGGFHTSVNLHPGYFLRKITYPLPYSYQFSRVYIFARIRAETPKCAKSYTIITRSKEVRENKSARKFSKCRFSEFDDTMLIFLTIYDALYIPSVGERENKSARKLSKFKMRENKSARKLSKFKVRENRFAQKSMRIG